MAKIIENLVKKSMTFVLENKWSISMLLSSFLFISLKDISQKKPNNNVGGLANQKKHGFNFENFALASCFSGLAYMACGFAKSAKDIYQR